MYLTIGHFLQVDMERLQSNAASLSTLDVSLEHAVEGATAIGLVLDAVARIGAFIQIYTRVIRTFADATDTDRPQTDLLVSEEAQGYFGGGDLDSEANSWRHVADTYASVNIPSLGVLHWAVREMHQRQSQTLPAEQLDIVLKLFKARVAISHAVDEEPPEFPTTKFDHLTPTNLKFAKLQWSGGVEECCSLMHRINAAVSQKTIDASVILNRLWALYFMKFHMHVTHHLFCSSRKAQDTGTRDRGVQTDQSWPQEAVVCGYTAMRGLVGT